MAAAAAKAQQIADAKRRVREAFVVFEHKDNSRLMEIREVPTVVRSLGLNPTTAQLQSLQSSISAAVAAAAEAQGNATASAGSNGTATYVTLEQCESLIATWIVELKDALSRDDFHTLMRAFQALDPEHRGWLDAEQVKALLTACEDPLSVEEANALIAVAADNVGRINYQEYALRLATDGREV